MFGFKASSTPNAYGTESSTHCCLAELSPYKLILLFTVEIN